MKIAFLVKDITANGGVERVVVTLANNLSKIYNHKVKIISLNKPQQISIGFNINENIEIEYLNYIPKYKDSLKSCFYELLFIKKFIRNINTEILITTTYHNVYLAFLKPFLKLKVIASHHEEYSSDTYKWNKLKKILYKNLDKVILLTKSDYDIYKDFNKKVEIISNAIPFKSEYLYNSNNKKIITVSRLSSEKSIEYSINAFKELHKKYPEWSFEIIGDGPDREKLNKLICDCKLQNYITISGFCNEIKEKYRQASFTILTSQKEGFGCVLIESKAVGVPVISFDNIGPSEIIRNEIDGFLVKKII